jgi:hypothetical protein
LLQSFNQRIYGSNKLVISKQLFTGFSSLLG